ncbi:craniofacial development protein 2-like [Amphiura filiformis]|uniref:craniofacial development protein 2-like n=1 Tax=Amphiura filiformis TaxID=82378 RepID=UPI003B217BE7
MGISENHWIESGDFTQDGYQILSAGSGSTHRAGVALILNKNAQRSLLGYNPILERLITARLRTQIGTASIMQVYAPTTSYPDEDIEDFYDQLQLEINKTPSQDMEWRNWEVWFWRSKRQR